MAVRKTPAEKLALLEQRKAQLEARIQREQAKAKAAQRKQDTRRKIIVGALALEHAGIDPAFDAALQRLIRRYVVRSDDRALFGLSPIADDTGSPPNRDTEHVSPGTHSNIPPADL